MEIDPNNSDINYIIYWLNNITVDSFELSIPENITLDTMNKITPLMHVSREASIYIYNLFDHIEEKEDIINNITFTKQDKIVLGIMILSSSDDQLSKYYQLFDDTRDDIMINSVKDNIRIWNHEFFNHIFRELLVEELYTLRKLIMFDIIHIIPSMNFDIRKRKVTREQEQIMMYKLVFREKKSQSKTTYKNEQILLLDLFLNNGMDPNFFNENLHTEEELLITESLASTSEGVLKKFIEHGNTLKISTVKSKKKLTILSIHKTNKERGKPNLIKDLEIYQTQKQQVCNIIHQSINMGEKGLAKLISDFM